MHKTDENDPPGVQIKLIILYSTSTPVVGQTLFYFSDMGAAESLKQTLLTWAAADEANHLHINAAPAPTPTAAPPETSAIAI